MGATQDNEAALEEIKTLLENNLPSELTTIENDKNDGITLEDPADYFFGERSKLNQTPAIHVVPGGGPLSQGNQFMETDLNVSIFVTLKENQPENLKKKVMRYIKGIRKVLEKNEDSANSLGFDFDRGGGVNYSPTLAHAENANEFLQGGRISLLVMNRETFG